MIPAFIVGVSMARPPATPPPPFKNLYSNDIHFQKSTYIYGPDIAKPYMYMDRLWINKGYAPIKAPSLKMV